MTARAACSIAVALVSLVLLSDRARSAAGAPAPSGARGVGTDLPASRPIRIEAPAIRIEANAGQADAEVLYLARGPRFTALFLARGVEVVPAGRSGAVRLSFTLDGGAAAGVEPTPERVHYFTGSDPDRWRRDIPTFAAVRYAPAADGVDLEARADEAGVRLRWTLPPGTDPATLVVETEGSLSAEFLQERENQRIGLEGRVVRRGASRLGFETTAADTTRPVVIEARLAPPTEVAPAGSPSPDRMSLRRPPTA